MQSHRARLCRCKINLGANLFRINTCKSVSKQTTLTTFRINTYEKPGGGVSMEWWYGPGTSLTKADRGGLLTLPGSIRPVRWCSRATKTCSAGGVRGALRLFPNTKLNLRQSSCTDAIPGRKRLFQDRGLQHLAALHRYNFAQRHCFSSTTLEPSTTIRKPKTKLRTNS